VVNRSQTDAAYAAEQKPSDFVLMPAGTSGKKGGAGSNSSNDSAYYDPKMDHVTELGFKNDGYDYSQHLKVMGGGKFIGLDNKVIDLPSVGSVYDQDGSSSSSSSSANPNVSSLILPKEALPSEKQLKRDLNAVTIGAEYMDLDLHAALFDEEDEDGEFEELLDDFCLTAMQEPEAPDFDFDAHIAGLIAKSERDNKCAVAPRGWDKNATGGTFLRDGEEDGQWEEDDDDDSGNFDEDDFDFDDEDEEDEDGEGGRRGAGENEHFEKVFEEYDDDDIGGLSEDEEEIEGVVDVDDDLLNDALDEFIQDEKDRILIDGVNLTKGIRHVPKLGELTGNPLDDPEYLVGVEPTPELIKEAVSAQEERQQEALEFINAFNAKKQNNKHLNGYKADGDSSMHNRNRSHKSDVGYHREAKLGPDGGDDSEPEDAIVTCQAYLTEQKPEEEFDCETIISTYSILDNHPSIIRSDADATSNKKNRKKISQAARAKQAQVGLSGFDDTASMASGRTTQTYQSYVSSRSGHLSLASAASGKISLTGPNAIKKGHNQIILKGKYNLPVSQSGEYFHEAGRIHTGFNSTGEAGDHSFTNQNVLSLNVEEFAKQCLITPKQKAMAKNLNRKSKRAGGGVHIPSSIAEGEEEDSDVSEDEDGEEEGGAGAGAKKVKPTKRRNETPEEKKARKQAAKEQKQTRRAEKKQTKLMYKAEAGSLNAALSGGQDINNVTVFKYSR